MVQGFTGTKAPLSKLFAGVLVKVCGAIYQHSFFLMNSVARMMCYSALTF